MNLELLSVYLKGIDQFDFKPLMELIAKYDSVMAQETQIISHLIEFEPSLDKELKSMTFNDHKSLVRLNFLTAIYGIIVPLRLYELDLIDQLNEIITNGSRLSQNQLDLFFMLLRHLRFRECFQGDACMFIKLFDRQPPTPDLFKFKPNIFDKRYVEFRRFIHDGKSKNIDDYEKYLFQMESAQTKHSHRIILKDAQNFIDRLKKQKERLEQQRLKQLNQYKLFDDSINLIESEEQMNERKLFLKDEAIFVPESQTIEYKNLLDLNDTKRLFIIKKALVSFLNAQGGTLFIGVHDDLHIKGINTNFTESEIINLIQKQCIDCIHPLPSFDSYTIKLIPIYDGRTGLKLQNSSVIKIIIRPQSVLHVFTFSEYIHLYDMESTFCFQRFGDSSKSVRQDQLNSQMLISFIRQSRKKIRRREIELVVSDQNDYSSKSWDQEYIFRKFKSYESFHKLRKALKTIQEQRPDIVEGFDVVQQYIFLKGDLKQFNEEFRKQELEFDSFKYGKPLRLLQISKKENLDSIDDKIKSNLKIFNYSKEINSDHYALKFQRYADIKSVFDFLRNDSVKKNDMIEFNIKQKQKKIALNIIFLIKFLIFLIVCLNKSPLFFSDVIILL
ncbi:hypothetical protein pb186bvf_003051 [Paramecium bursaria]